MCKTCAKLLSKNFAIRFLSKELLNVKIQLLEIGLNIDSVWNWKKQDKFERPQTNTF